MLIHSTCRINYPRLHSEITDIADLWQVSCYNRLIITYYSPYQEAKKALYLPSMVWFPFPHTTDMFHVIFSYNATKENHTPESHTPRNQVCTFYLRTATALNSACPITALNPNPRTFDKLALPYKCQVLHCYFIVRSVMSECPRNKST